MTMIRKPLFGWVRAPRELLDVLKARPLLSFALLSVLIVVVVFADVVFKHASISMIDIGNFPGLYRAPKTLLHERAGLEPIHSLFDPGGAALQSEPAIQYMKNVIYSLQSPYWDPYSATGSYGLETIVDIKLSPITLAVAVLGGSNLAFHFITLLFYSLALFFIYRILVEELGYGVAAASVACLVFLLNGYFTANLSSNTNQVLLYFPFATYSMLRFCRKPDVRSFMMVVGACTLTLLVSFFPTTVMMLTALSAVSVGALLQYRKNLRDRLRLLAALTAAGILAGGLLAFFYLPLYEALRFVAGLEQYSARVFTSANVLGIINLFTPKHFSDGYNAAFPEYAGFLRNVVFHVGLVAGLLAFLAVANIRSLKSPVMAAMALLLLFSLGRIFGAPGITELVDHLPFYKNVGGQYWWMPVGCALPFVVAAGFELLRSNSLSLKRVWPVVILAAVLLADLAYIGKTFGLPKGDNPSFINAHRAINYVIIAVFIILGTVACIFAVRRYPKSRILLTGLLAVALFLDLLNDFNTARLVRQDVFAHPPSYVQFLRDHVGLNRVANFGSSGLPAELGAAYQIQQVESFTMNIFPDYYRFCQRNLTSEHGWWGKDTFCVNRDTKNEPNINEAALNLLSVRYIVVAKTLPQFLKFFEERHYPQVFDFPSVVIFENLAALPRIFAVSHLLSGPQTPDSQGFDPRVVALTEDPQLLKLAQQAGVSTEAPSSNALASSAQAQITRFENAHVRAEAEVGAPAVLALMDNWHPNWTVTVDGQPSYLGKINESFRGVVLPPGHHVIEMMYQPATLPLALGVTFMSSLGLGLILFFRRKVNHFLEHFLGRFWGSDLGPQSEIEIYNSLQSPVYFAARGENK